MAKKQVQNKPEDEAGVKFLDDINFASDAVRKAYDDYYTKKYINKMCEDAIKKFKDEVNALRAHEIFHSVYGPRPTSKSQLLKEIAAELGLDYKEANVAEPDASNCKGIPNGERE